VDRLLQSLRDWVWHQPGPPDAEALVLRRLPIAVGIFLASVAISGIFEALYFPERLPIFVLFFAAEVAVAVALHFTRDRLVGLGLLVPGVAGAVSTLLLLMIGYVIVTQADSRILAIAVVCVLMGMSLFLPWSMLGQGALVAAALVGFGANLWLNPGAGVFPAYQLFSVSAGAFLSLIGAHYVDMHRSAMQRESLLKDEAVFEARSLLHVASTLNSSLEADAVLERIVHSIRDTLSCDYGLILLWDDRRQVFRLAAGSTNRRDLLEEAREMDFGPDNFPVIKRLLTEEDLVELSAAYPPDPLTRAMLDHYRTRALLAATMVRGGRVVGLMAAGRSGDSSPFSAVHRRLMRGIAQQAAVALENTRLVADLRQADRLKSDFVSTVSHELRTPMNIILGYTDLLAEGAYGELRAEQREVIDRVRLNSTELLHLINAALDVNRLEAGRLPLDVEDISLSDLLAEVRREAETLPRTEGVQLHWHVNGTQSLCTDPRKLKIILRNLVGNALKFTERGSVTVSLAQPNPEGVELAVADTGIGIPPDELPHIFQMFRQVRSTAGRSGGVGLGLYIVDRFVRQLRGEIDVKSAPGKGTTFVIRLPQLGRSGPDA